MNIHVAKNSNFGTFTLRSAKSANRHIYEYCQGNSKCCMYNCKSHVLICDKNTHSTKKPVTTMLTYPWKCTVLHCNHLGNTWKPLVLMTRHFDYCPSASEGDNQSVRLSAPVVSRCFPGGYNVKLYISRGRLAWWLLAFLHSDVKYDSQNIKQTHQAFFRPI